MLPYARDMAGLLLKEARLPNSWLKFRTTAAQSPRSAKSKCHRA